MVSKSMVPPETSLKKSKKRPAIALAALGGCGDLAALGGSGGALGGPGEDLGRSGGALVSQYLKPIS